MAATDPNSRTWPAAHAAERSRCRSSTSPQGHGEVHPPHAEREADAGDREQRDVEVPTVLGVPSALRAATVPRIPSPNVMLLTPLFEAGQRRPRSLLGDLLGGAGAGRPMDWADCSQAARGRGNPVMKAAL
jgi:hypothetical protein